MLEEKILNDYRQALKDKDKLKVSVLSFLRAEMINVAMAKKIKQLDDKDVISVIRKQIKSRQDSIEAFEKGNRQDLADKEKKELLILKTYLPAELAEDELNKIIAEVISEVGAQGPKDMGKVMKEVTPKVAGRADGKRVSDLVKKKLTPPKDS
ncbi:MAG: GatB/YqeY domain-containing protein [Candidatus Omnitrophica bacterium]|nr:GatB/YqeY domain-containing protein [Candidatus Omnitrophota bacterium]